MSAVVLNAVLVSDSPAPGDAELVERFVIARDQAAFAELVHRHSAVVLGVCRRVLRDTHDIDDVFQATFLVFVRDAARVRKRKSLASWLYGVAYRLSLRVARQKQRRRETSLVDDNLIDDDTFGKLTDRHDQQLVDIELNTLSERYRQPLVLKYLSGHSTDEIATELGITVGAVEGLLKRGKDELRRRLLQRGITLGVALVAVQVAQQTVEAAISESLIETTVQAGFAWNSGSDTPTSDLVSNQAVELARTEIIAMTTTTKTVLAAGLTLGGLVIGFGGVDALMSDHSGGKAEAAGLITTMSVAQSAHDTVALANLTSDPVSKNGDDDSAQLSTSLAAEVELKASGQNNKPKATKRSTGDWDFKSRSPNVVRIENALMDDTEVNFTDQPLKNAFDYLEDLHHIEILIDQSALADEGISTDQNVNLVLSGISLKSALRLMLDPLQLDYLIQNDVMFITTREKARESFETRAYNLGLLPEYTPAELMEIIIDTIEPDSWSDKQLTRMAALAASKEASGGTMMKGGGKLPGTAPTQEAAAGDSNIRTGGMGGGGFFGASEGEGRIRATKKTLVIRQTQRIHAEIVELLNQLK